eukprot:282743_1
MVLAIVFLGIVEYIDLVTLYGVNIDRKKWQFIANMFDAKFIEVCNDGDKKTILDELDKIKDILSDFHNILFVVSGHGTMVYETRTLCLVTKNGSNIPIEYIIEKYSLNKWSSRKIFMKFAYVLDLCFGNITLSDFSVDSDVALNSSQLQNVIRIDNSDWTQIIGAALPYLTTSTNVSGGGHLTDLMCRGILQCTRNSDAKSHSLIEFVQAARYVHKDICTDRNCSGIFQQMGAKFDDFTINISDFNLSHLQQQSETQLMAEYAKLDQIRNDNGESHESMIENITSTISSTLSSGISLGMSWLASTINKGHESNNINIKYIQEINAYRGHLLVSGYIYYIIDINYGYHKVIREIIRAFLIGNIDNKNKNISPVIIINCCSFGHLSEPIKLNQLTLYDKNKYNKCWMDCRNRLMPASIIYYCLKCKCIICKECIAKNHGDYELFKKYLAERKNIYINHQIFKETNGKGKLELVTYNINKNQKKWVLVRINDNMNLGEYDTNSNNDKKNQNKQIFLVKSLKNSKCRKWICRTCLYEIKAPQANKRKR